jgi:malate dehydrogenase (oxaloacetate-decarboxylating)(NADP+)
MCKLFLVAIFEYLNGLVPFTSNPLTQTSYVFPGLGLGAILAKASRVTDTMVYTSAAALSGCLNREEIRMGLIYPKIERVRDASLIVAREVMKCARRDGVSMLPEETWIEWEEWGDVALTAWIKKQIYDPKF